MSSIRSVLIIKGASQYEVLRYVCDELMRAFCTHGCPVTVIDLTSFRHADYTTDLFSPYDLIISFDGIGIDLYNQMLKKPLFWMLFVDHPFYLHERLKQINGKVIVSCVDRRHVDYIDKYYSEIPWTCFMPHGGLTGEIPSVLSYEKRIYDITMIASLGDINNINPLIKKIQEEYEAISAPVIENAIFDMNADLECLVHDRLIELGITFDESMFRELLYVLRPIDALRRYYKRSSLISSLCACGITVDIWGNGWEKYVKDYNLEKNVRLHGCSGYEETKYIMRNSRIVLNDMPLFHDGSHERIFAAMQSGAIVATDRSIYLEECFSDNKDILFYDINNIDRLANTIRALLNNNEKANNIINNSLIASQYHTWKDRSDAIIAIAEEINNT